MAEFLIGNIKGPKGETGPGFKVLDYYPTLEALASNIANPSVGDAYGIGIEAPYDIYIYSNTNGWVNNGAIQGAKGDDGKDGKDGTNATITNVSATVDNTSGTPNVTVSMGGTDRDRTFSFAFSGLKGEQGPQGESGADCIETVTYAGSDTYGWTTTATTEEEKAKLTKITFSAPPKVVYVAPVGLSSGAGVGTLVALNGQRIQGIFAIGGDGHTVETMWEGNSVFIGSDNAIHQYNASDTTYMAVGLL